MNIKKPLTSWQKLVNVLRELKISHETFTGKVEIDLRDGGVSTVKRIETLK